MKTMRSIILYAIVLTMISGCTSQTQSIQDKSIAEKEVSTKKNPDVNEYKGIPLKIGVLGSAPEIRETNIEFQELSLEDLSIKKVEEYDGIFIMKEFLESAADGPYSNTFKKSDIPFFFIETKAYYFPFIEDKISYKDYTKRVTDSVIYAFGYYPNSGNVKTWQLNITAQDPSEKEKKEIIKEIYSQIFVITEEVKNTVHVSDETSEK
ncbi:hypothetical protein ACQKMD_11315 [Viridibacillus sp. NPDC096237]|uniref:hypothetical protein n=1 Tax=Viridibacillus sp. NPDC096237 TaxID=3390721 RepID=UPI003D011F79